MLSRFRAHFRQQFVGYIAIFMVLGGTAYAANEWTGENIVDGSIKTADIRDDNLTGADILNDSLRGQEIKNGQLTGVDVENNSLKGADVDEASLSGLGVRAYGRVAADGTVSLSKGVSGNATNPISGTYCLTIPGANPSQQPMVVGPEHSDNSTNIGEHHSVVEWTAFGGADCPASAYSVHTFAYAGDATDDTDEPTDKPGDNLFLDNESFVFIVP